MTQLTYEIVDDGKAVRCLVCGLTSYHPEDVKQKFCGNCRRWHGRFQEDEDEQMIEFKGGRFCVGIWFAGGTVPFDPGRQGVDCLMAVFRESNGEYTGLYRMRYHDPDSEGLWEGNKDRKSWYRFEIDHNLTPEQVYDRTTVFAKEAFGLVGEVDCLRVLGDSIKGFEMITKRPWCHIGEGRQIG